MGRRGGEGEKERGFITFLWLLNVRYELCMTAYSISDTNKHTQTCVIGNCAHNSFVSKRKYLLIANLHREWLLYASLRQYYFHVWVMVLNCMSGELFTQSEGGILVMINAIRHDLQSRISATEVKMHDESCSLPTEETLLCSALCLVYLSELSSALLCLLSQTKKKTSLCNVFSLSASLIKTSVNTFPCPWCRWISTGVWRKLNINGVSLLHIILHNNLLF